jgi:hypothetical protein
MKYTVSRDSGRSTNYLYEVSILQTRKNRISSELVGFDDETIHLVQFSGPGTPIFCVTKCILSRISGTYIKLLYKEIHRLQKFLNERRFGK